MEDESEGWSDSVAYRSVCGGHFWGVRGIDEEYTWEYCRYVLVDETSRALWHTTGEEAAAVRFKVDELGNL